MLFPKTSKHVGPATELNCLIPIKPGFIPALDTRTYATRLRIVFKVLQVLRTQAREVRLVNPILDIVDSARTVQAFSWAIVNERQLLLNVAFDRPWEPYIRIVWRDLGPLLDLFLCNCVDFAPSSKGFEPFAAFVRKHQVDTGFFYPASSLTVDDQRYVAGIEKAQRDGGRHVEAEAATLVAGDFHAACARARKQAPLEAINQWLGVLNALHGLRNIYPDEDADHLFLHRAAVVLLAGSRPDGVPRDLAEVRWFDAPPQTASRAADPPLEPRDVVLSEIQGGILKSYGREISHACVLLARVTRPDAARRFIGELADAVSRADTQRGKNIQRNVAFTFNGLRQLGIAESDLAAFPREFAEGMAARAGLLGDLRQNHPENWTLPDWNVRFHDDSAEPVEFLGADGALPPIRVSTVDIVVTMHYRKAKDRSGLDEAVPLAAAVRDFCLAALDAGIEVLSVQRLHREAPGERTHEHGGPAREHFGFVDGLSQPVPTLRPGAPNEVPFGELLVGYQNERGDPPFPEDNAAPMFQRGSLIDNGSFLVIRKLRQNVPALRDAIEKNRPKGLSAEQVLAAMMGRTLDGVPLLRSKATQDRHDNAFHFGTDPVGAVCPFHAHIRRANPRFDPAQPPPGVPPVPRLARRGMLYGPRHDEGAADADRGVFFMAYNASIAEQFEIIQRWMSGGNTPAGRGGTGVFSGQPDPFLGLPDADGKRTYRFVHKKRVYRIDLGPTPFVSLQWGLYAFAPSIAALKRIARDPAPDAARLGAMLTEGRRLLALLKSLDDWATVLEDITPNIAGVTAALYLTIQTDHAGVLETPYGVLVTSAAGVDEVLRRDDVFSVAEYQRRFGRSVGEGYLGLDRGADYDRLSRGPNDALTLVSEEQAFEQAYDLATDSLRGRIDQLSTAAAALAAAHAAGTAPRPGKALVPLPLEPVVDHVVAELSRRLFDIPDGALIVRGGRPAANDTLHCPFHLLATSRYVFSSPHPRPKVEELGEAHGQRLLAAVKTFVAQQRQQPSVSGPVAKALFAMPYDDDLLARTLLGLALGFGPTVYGNALQVLGLWLDDETLWRMQQRLLVASGATAFARAEALRRPLELAMQKRPVPPLLHRHARKAYNLGGVNIKENSRVVLAIAGATQDVLARGGSNPKLVFGGDRGKTDAPTHACPGSHLAMGALLGMLTAILEIRPLVPTPALLTVRVRARVPPQAAQAAAGSPS